MRDRRHRGRRIEGECGVASNQIYSVVALAWRNDAEVTLSDTAASAAALAFLISGACIFRTLQFDEMPAIDALVLPRIPERGATDARWRITEAAAECAVEMGKVGKSGFLGDVGDFPILPARIAQQRHRLFEALVEEMLGEAAPGRFQQQMHVAGRDTQLERDGGGVQAGIAELLRDHALDRRQARRTGTALFGYLTRLAFGSDRQRDEIDEVFAVAFGCA